MFGLQKQRRNATSGGAWFIAGHLTVFAKLSHHAVPLESRIFSSRCFSFSVSPLPLPPSHLVVPPTAVSPSSLLRYHLTKTTHSHRFSSSRTFAGISELPMEDAQRMRADFRDQKSTNGRVTNFSSTYYIIYFSYNFYAKKGDKSSFENYLCLIYSSVKMF